MILNPEGKQVIAVDEEMVRLTLSAHRAVNGCAYWDRYNFRKAIQDSGLIEQWRKEFGAQT